MISLRDRPGESTVEIGVFLEGRANRGLPDRFRSRGVAVSHISSRYGAPNSNEWRKNGDL